MNNKSLILHLFGSSTKTYKCALEIHNIILQNHFGCKIIENKYLIQEINRNVTRDVLINTCMDLSIQERIQLYDFQKEIRKKHWYSQNLFILSNAKVYHPSSNLYSMDSSIIIKTQQIKKLLYSDYNTLGN
jgi:hypothetical protein